MNIHIGSKNPTKVKAVQSAFPKACIRIQDVKSDVSAQPFSDEETRLGAINRAKQCASRDALGIGLAGGVMYVNKHLYLCNWGALVTPEEDIYTASGARIHLPQEIAEQLHKGYELGDVIDKYAEKQAVRNKEGAIGIFTNDLIDRQIMFRHVVLLLKGQWEYWQ